MQILFEVRFGGNLYRPIGLEWKQQDYWAVYDHPFTIEQFLSTKLGIVEPPPQMYPDGTRPLNIVDKVVDGIYYCQDIDSGQYNKAITLAKFMEMKFDFVIASIPQHISRFKRLVDQHPNHPKLIYQIGNAWNIDPDLERLADGILASARLERRPIVPFIEYHQEFDTKLFKPAAIPKNKTITSFINCFNVEQMFAADWQLFTKIEKLMPDWVFKALGGQCRDGAAHGAKNLAKEMQNTRFIWHTKFGGDGYGHIIHNAAATGTPIVAKKQYYAGKMAEALLIDGQTCIAIDNLNPVQIINKIEYYNQPPQYELMAKNVYNYFMANVNFDIEAEKIHQFLESMNGKP